MGIFQAHHRAHQINLHVKRQTGGNAIRVKLVRGQSFWLQENLVLILVGKAVNFVLNRWAIAWADTLDHAGVHRRAAQTATDNLVGALIGVRDPAWNLARMLLRPPHEGEYRYRV